MTTDVIDTEPAVDAHRVPATAWARFWARLFDMMVLGAVMALVMGLLLPDFVASVDNDGLFGMLVLPFALMLEVIVYAACGTTLGKALVGIDLATVRGDRVSLPVLARRQVLVWTYGLALGIPIFALFTYMGNAKKLETNQLTLWDKRYFTRVTGEPSALRVSIAGMSWLGLAVGMAAWNA